MQQSQRNGIGCCEGERGDDRDRQNKSLQKSETTRTHKQDYFLFHFRHMRLRTHRHTPKYGLFFFKKKAKYFFLFL